MLRTLRDPARCRYRSCAVVGAGGTLLGARLGAEIDRCEAVIRINLTPDGPMAAEAKAAPHHHLPTWIADLGARTTWRVLTMEVYGYLSHYSRFWLKPPRGHGRHPNMSGIPQEPLLAVSCHTPTRSMGRCRAERIQQTFGHPYSASYLINPLLLRQTQRRFFRDAINQHVPSTGMTAIAIAEQMCDVIHLYGFANGSCLDAVRALAKAGLSLQREAATHRVTPRLAVLSFSRVWPLGDQCSQPIQLLLQRQGVRRIPQLLRAGECTPGLSTPATRA